MKTKHKSRIVIYSDSVVYGGHEMTLYDVILGMIESEAFEIVTIVSEKNTRFLKQLSQISEHIAVVTTRHETIAGDVFRVLFNTSKAKEIVEEISAFEPDAVIVSQGAIALSACALGSKRKIGAPLISFLPMAHSVTQTQKRRSVTSTFQDILYEKLYALPDYYFTICQSTADQLHDLHKIDRKRIFMTYFGVDTTIVPKVNYRFDVKSSRNLGIIGRVEFYQKRHDFLLYELAQNKINDDISVWVIGDGPDLDACKKLVDDLGMAKRVHFSGWVDDVTNWYQRLDALILPSRFEGLPLVVLEAMLYGIPVIASRVDGMREVLPEQWLFEEGNGQEMVTTIQHVFGNDQKDLVDDRQEYVISNINRETFKKEFSQNLMRICNL